MKKPVKRTNPEKKLTAAQAHQYEFHRTIKDLGTEELKYRLSQNDIQIASSALTIEELSRKLKQFQKVAAALAREHTVLTAAIDGRR